MIRTYWINKLWRLRGHADPTIIIFIQNTIYQLILCSLSEHIYPSLPFPICPNPLLFQPYLVRPRLKRVTYQTLLRGSGFKQLSLLVFIESAFRVAACCIAHRCLFVVSSVLVLFVCQNATAGVQTVVCMTICVDACRERACVYFTNLQERWLTANCNRHGCWPKKEQVTKSTDWTFFFF